MSTLPAERDYLSVLPALLLIGAGVGSTFPALSIGSMGSIQGQELGLGSGIVNMSRQVGFAIGIALIVAVFTGSIDNQIKDARNEVAAVLGDNSQSKARFFASLEDPADPNGPRAEPHTAAEQKASTIVREHVRDSYGVAFRVAAFVTLLGIPFTLTMRRRPMDTQRSPDAPAASSA